MSIKKTLITGITGQDTFPIWPIFCWQKRTRNTERIYHRYQDPHVEHRNLILHYGDLTDRSNLTRFLHKVQPNEVYNFARRGQF